MRQYVLVGIVLTAATLTVSVGVRPATGAGAKLLVPSDLYPTIQSALDAVPDGGTIAVAKGVYSEALHLTGKTNVTIAGKEAVVDSDGADVTLWIQGCADVVVTGFSFREGSKVGVLFEDCAGGSIGRCAIVDQEGAGLLLDGSNGVTVSSCQFRNVGTDGVSGLAGTEGTTVCKCVVEDAANDGIVILGTSDAGAARTSIVGNTVARTGGRGIVTGGAQFVVSKNRVSDAGGDSICADSETVATSAVVISGNTLTGGLRGIRLEGSSGTVTKNRIAAPVFGMVISGTNHLVGGNSVTDANSSGIVIHATGCTLDKNKVANVLSRGFHLSSGPNQVLRCSATGCGVGGFLVGGTGSTLTGNKAKDCGEPVAVDLSAPGANTWTKNRFEVFYDL